MDDLPKDIYLQKHPIFLLANDHELNLGKAKAKDFYWILNKQSHQTLPSGPKKWNREFEVELRTNGVRVLFLRQLKVFDCRENELKEFQFKSLHRIVILPKRNYVALESNKRVTVYIVEKQIPSITHSSPAILHNLSSKMYSIGSTL